MNARAAVESVRAAAQRNGKPARRRSGGKRRTVLVLAGLVVIALFSLVFAAWFSAPSTSDFTRRVEAAAGTSTPLSFSHISSLLRQAVVATEDERFYRHHGIDVIGIVRAIPYDVTHLSLSQGASTITEQLAKRLYLNGNDHSPWRKLQDAILALRIERHHSKEQILAAYLDSAYFGRGAVGIRAAARRYFGRDPARLTLSQATLLAGLIQAPSAYDPALHQEAARERQVDVLRSMVRNGDITVAEGIGVLAHALPLRDAGALPPFTGADLARGSAFVWSDVAAAAGLVVLGAAMFVLRARVGHRTAFALVAALLVAAGLLTFARSFRTL